MRKFGFDPQRPSRGLLGPLIALVIASLLLYDVAATPVSGVAKGAYGPTSWPIFTLVLVVAGLALLCVLRMRSASALHAPQKQITMGGSRRVVVAALLIALYGASFEYAGFLLGTIAFMAAWLIFAGVRQPLRILLISVVGTILPLYLLIKVAYMPLPRGVGVFEQATLQLYRVLGFF